MFFKTTEVEHGGFLNKIALVLSEKCLLHEILVLQSLPGILPSATNKLFTLKISNFTL